MTDVDVVQAALAELGETTTVTSLTTPTTKGERLGAIFYPRVVARLLRHHNWSWATVRAALTVTTEERLGWAYAYELPAGLAKVIAVDLGYRGGSQTADLGLGDEAADPSLPTIPFTRARWAIEANNAKTGKLFLCDIKDAELVYVFESIPGAGTSTPLPLSLWSAEFYDAVVLDLAARMAMPMNGKGDLAKGLAIQAKVALSEAVAADENESLRDPQPDSAFITGRSW